MKYLLYTIVFGLMFIHIQIMGQAATGGCTILTVTQVPVFHNLYKDQYDSYKLCNIADPCLSPNPENYCCRISMFFQLQMLPRLHLQRKMPNGNFITVDTKIGGAGYTFTNLTKGTYRVLIQIPIHYVGCCEKLTQIYNTVGQYIGFMGVYSNDAGISYTNEVLVGPADQNDIIASLIDPNNNNAYDVGDEVFFDATQSTHYDQWLINVQETGPTHSRWASTHWQLGTQASVEDIELLWVSSYGSFEPFHSYNMSFVIENNKCRNAIEWPAPEWNMKNYLFFMCPPGTGCKLRKKDLQLTLSPNPANDQIRIADIDEIWNEGYNLLLRDMQGRVILDQKLNQTELDISHIPSGLYIAVVHKLGEILHTTKLIVQK